MHPVRPFFLTALLSLFTGVVYPVAPARAADDDSFCAKAGIASLTFSGIPAVPLSGDACRLRATELPPKVRRIVDGIAQVHRAVAETIGQSFAETFSPPVPVRFAATGDGSFASETIPDAGIIMSVFADTTFADWPKVSYSHELTHFLIFTNPTFATVVRGLETHPFVAEALPDLVALSANRVRAMPTEDEGLPPALRIARDATSVRSLDEPFATYSLFAPNAALARACAKVPAAARGTPHVQAVCALGDPDRAEGFYSAMPGLDSDLRAPPAAALAAPFDPAECLYTMHGVPLLGACNSHQFALPLTSFFIRLERALGRPQVARWIDRLKAEAPSASRFACAYLAGKDTLPAEIILRGVAPSLRALREGLSSSDAAKFDQVWNAHGFAKLAALDALYLGPNRNAEALLPLLRANPRYGHDCGSPFTLDPKACAVECRASAN